MGSIAYQIWGHLSGQRLGMAESFNVFKNQIMKLNLSDITVQGCIRDCHLLASPKVGFKHIFMDSF